MEKKKTLRNSAKAVIIREDKILLLRKADKDGSYTVLPGGGQNFNETLEQTLEREVMEEVGAEVEVGELLHIREYFSEKHQFAFKDRALHQIEFFFRAELKTEPDPSRASELDSNQKEVVWVILSELDAANFYPAAMHEALSHLESGKFPVYLGDCN
ncbi:MAG: NUDIX domain-containing protein [Anaerolineaceae bacterium]|nr:NUDIX domain-containing protein [Anaerolineaceae bacterium]